VIPEQMTLVNQIFLVSQEIYSATSDSWTNDSCEPNILVTQKIYSATSDSWTNDSWTKYF